MPWLLGRRLLGSGRWTHRTTGQAEDDRASARELLEGVAIRTPMEESRWLSKIAGGPVLLKAENLQRAGSFKIRGAYIRMHGLSEEERAHGVVAASAGNHAQGVALAAQLLGIKAVVYMPHGAPIPKEKATRGYGAEVRFHGHTIDEALVEARKYADETGAVLVHPFDHPDIVAGQATCGARDPRAGARRRAPSSCRPAAAASSPASPRSSSGTGPTSGSSASRRRARRRTRPRWRRASRRP